MKKIGKTMTQEEKAKAYDEALKRAKQFHNKELYAECNGNLVEYIFPELKQSEDERMIKALKQGFFEYGNSFTTFGGIKVGDIIAWLEKQKDHEAELDKAYKTADEVQYRRGYEDAKREIEKQGDQDNNEDVNVLQRFSFYSYKDEPNVLYLSGLYVNEEYRNKGIGTKILKIANKVSTMMKCNYIRLKAESGSDAERLYKENGYNTLKKEGNQVWLEKQEDIEYVFRPLAGCDINTAAIQALEQQKLGKKIVLAFNGAYIPVEEKTADDIVNEYYSWLEKQGEKKSIDDLTSQEAMDIAVAKCFDGCEKNPAGNAKPKFNVGDWITDGHLHCKVTDILEDRYIVDTKYSKRSSIPFKCENNWNLWTIQDAKDGDVLVDGNFVGLFKENNYNSSDESGCTYFYCSFDMDNNKFYTESGGYNPTYLYPAVKEQRDILFQKMKEAGYKWNSDKKELEKIVIDEGKDEMDYCFTKMMLGEPSKNSEWSEEDDKIVRDITNEISYIKGTAMVEQYKHVLDGEIDWLKGIKKRILNKG